MFEEDYLSYVDDEVKTLDYFDEDDEYHEEIPF